MVFGYRTLCFGTVRANLHATWIEPALAVKTACPVQKTPRSEALGSIGEGRMIPEHPSKSQEMIPFAEFHPSA
jgi:hypothetical protein